VTLLFPFLSVNRQNLKNFLIIQKHFCWARMKELKKISSPGNLILSTYTAGGGGILRLLKTRKVDGKVVDPDPTLVGT
jgi:hypothetical protein